jgi:Animal haem peroxidase
MKHASCLSPVRAQPNSARSSPYQRLFPELPSFEPGEEFLSALGRAGGLCDCGDDDDRPEVLGSEAAGWPFFGQFIGHDITADRSRLRTQVDPAGLRNARSEFLNLECLYADGPIGHPFLFQRQDPAKLLTGPSGYDVLRNAEGTAIIGDPRNDSHVIISQMHLAFVHAHNAFVDRVRAQGVPDDEVFDVAARELCWHYQTVVLREFLPRVIGQAVVDDLLHNGRRYYCPVEEPYIPLEFADAGYRYGHSQIRHAYALNRNAEPAAMFPDLIGFRPIPADQRVEWPCLFDAEGSPAAMRSKKIDGRLVGALIALPTALTGATEVAEFHSLAVRDLTRGRAVGLPSGEAIATHLGEIPLTADEVGAVNAGWKGETPLWYYILREADVRCDGNRLGPVGARIVGEVLVGLIELDPDSVLHAPAGWHASASLTDLLVGH